MAEINVQGIGDGLTPQELNALEILTQLPVSDFNKLKEGLELDVPDVLGPTTLLRFVDVAKELKFDLSDAGIIKFKDDNHLGNEGILRGVIGPQTADIFYHEFKERFDDMEEDDGKRHINKAGLQLIKEFEGLARLIPGNPNHVRTYLDIVGVPTIGYGHTGKDVKLGQVISFADAEELLKKDLEVFERKVQAMIKVPVTENQFAALVSLAFNVGVGALKNSSLLRALNKKDYDDAANRFLRFSFAGGHRVNGLVRRRQAERRLFLLS